MHVREVAVSPANCDVEDQEEFLIKRRIRVSANVPRICKESSVLVLIFEFASLPEILFLEVYIEDLLESVIDIGVEIVF